MRETAPLSWWTVCAQGPQLASPQADGAFDHRCGELRPLDDLPVITLAVPALTTVGMDLTGAADNLTAGVLSAVGAPAPAAWSRSGAGDILGLIHRETTRVADAPPRSRC